MGRSSVAVMMVLLLFCAPDAFGVTWAGKMPFDGRRRGAIFGYGLGAGATGISSRNGDLSGDVTKGTAVILVKAGYAPSDRLLLYGHTRQAVYASKLHEHADSFADRMDSARPLAYVLFGILTPAISFFVDQHSQIGIGSDYYLTDGMPSVYLTGGLQAGWAADPYESKVASSFPPGARGGTGFHAGGGFEVTRHLQLELAYMWSRASYTVDSERRTWSAGSLTLTAIALAY